MATPPFSTDLVSDLAGETAWKFDGRIGAVFTPRFFCCDDPNTLGISEGKTPVAKFSLTPNPQLVSTNVTADGTDSYDPDGSITGYAWTFESHSPSSGTASTATLNYASPGTYTITLVVTDGTGLKSTPARQELVIKNSDFEAYFANTSSGGLVHATGIAGAETWTPRNTGLSGDDLEVYDVTIDPATYLLGTANHTLWRATAGGVQVSNNGGVSWVEKNPGNPTNQWSDGTALTISDLSFRAFAWGDERLFVGASGTIAAGDWRSWIWYTDNAAEMRADTSGSVTWTQITTTWAA